MAMALPSCRQVSSAAPASNVPRSVTVAGCPGIAVTAPAGEQEHRAGETHRGGDHRYEHAGSEPGQHSRDLHPSPFDAEFVNEVSARGGYGIAEPRGRSL